MTSLDEIRQIFFVECEEQLEELTDGLGELESAGLETEPDSETINTMFRAVHSVKGGAASFALDAITRYAHVFESVLDEVRGGDLALDHDILRGFYTAADYLADLVAMGAEGDEPDAATLEEHIEEIRSLSASASAGAPAVVENDDEEEGGEDVSDQFQPLALDFSDMGEDEAEASGFEITFVPSTELYANGHDPVHLFRELASLGNLTVAADLGDRTDDDAPSITWTLTLETDTDETEVLEIFEFAEPFAEIACKPVEAPEVDVQEPLVPGEQEEPDPNRPEPQLTVVENEEPKPEQGPSDDGAASADSGAPADSKSKPKAKTTVRVDLDLVDDLINSVGELVITQAVMSQSIMKLDRGAVTHLDSSLEEFRVLTRQIQEGIMAIRAQSVKPLFQRMGRIVRESAQIAGKDVRFVTEGEDTEIDRTVTERLVDPLTHILRNAVDHGLEADRAAAGKPASGTVTLSAAHRSGRVLIEIKDDGGGVNRDKVLASAIKKGLVPENANLAPSEIDRLLFLPGFSTADSVTKLSGRGVGMDVVNNEIKRLGGRVSISSEPGQGTTISISLPLTLAVLDGMIVNVAGQTLVVPIAAIGETIRPEPKQLNMVGKTMQMVTVRDVVIPTTDLGQLFGYSDTPALERGGVLILVEGDQGQQRALAVDGIQDQRQVVIKSLETNYGQVPYVAAATILGDGKIALIVDIDEITFHNSAPIMEGRRA